MNLFVNLYLNWMFGDVEEEFLIEDIFFFSLFKKI